MRLDPESKHQGLTFEFVYYGGHIFLNSLFKAWCQNLHEFVFKDYMTVHQNEGIQLCEWQRLHVFMTTSYNSSFLGDCVVQVGKKKTDMCSAFGGILSNFLLSVPFTDTTLCCRWVFFSLHTAFHSSLVSNSTFQTSLKNDRIWFNSARFWEKRSYVSFKL